MTEGSDVSLKMVPRVIFLDFDGVLNDIQFRLAVRKDGRIIVQPGHESFQQLLDPKRVALLNTLISDTRADVVISSSWGKFHSENSLRYMLENVGFKGRVLGLTPKKMSSDRSAEIRWWLREQPTPPDFVVLDDLYLPTFGHRFIRVEDGLEPRHVELARAAFT